MELSLAVLDRILLLQVLPKEGTILTLRVLRDLQREVSFSEAELAALHFEDMPNGGIKWDTAADVPKDLTVGAAGLQLILDAFKALDKSEKMTLAHLAVYEKFAAGLPPISLSP